MQTTLPDTAARRRSRRVVRASLGIGLPLASGIGGILLWELMVDVLGLPAYLLPAPSAVVMELIDRWPVLWSNLGYTVLAATTGFGIALLLGLVMGAAISASRTVDRILYPWLVLSHAVPKVVVAPLMLVWVGFGIQSGIIFVVFFTFFPIVVNTVTGLKSADPELIHLVRSMGAGPIEMLWKIRIPTALPSIFAGIKVSATLAPVGAVIGEFVASNQGLGYVLIQAVGSMETPLAFAAVVLISIFGIVIWYAAELVERACLPWHASQRNGGAG